VCGCFGALPATLGLVGLVKKGTTTWPSQLKRDPPVEVLVGEI
jgi:hypothetical protein